MEFVWCKCLIVVFYLIPFDLDCERIYSPLYSQCTCIHKNKRTGDCRNTGWYRKRCCSLYAHQRCYGISSITVVTSRFAWKIPFISPKCLRSLFLLCSTILLDISYSWWLPEFSNSINKDFVKLSSFTSELPILIRRQVKQMPFTKILIVKCLTTLS